MAKKRHSVKTMVLIYFSNINNGSVDNIAFDDDVDLMVVFNDGVHNMALKFQ